jgi:hypothetical protein
MQHASLLVKKVPLQSILNDPFRWFSRKMATENYSIYPDYKSRLFAAAATIAGGGRARLKKEVQNSKFAVEEAESAAKGLPWTPENSGSRTIS